MKTPAVASLSALMILAASSALLAEQRAGRRQNAWTQEQIKWITNHQEEWNKRGHTEFPLYHSTEQASQDIHRFNEILERHPDSWVTYFNRGLAYDYLGQTDQAIADYTNALDINPRDSFSLINRGIVYYEKSQYTLALADYNQAIAVDPGIANAHNCRGHIYLIQGDLKGALADFKQALTLEPNNPFTHDNLGMIYLAQGDHQQALKEFDKAIALDQKDPEPDRGSFYNNRAAAHLNLRHYEQSWQDVHHAEELGEQPAPELLRLLRQYSGREQ